MRGLDKVMQSMDLEKVDSSLCLGYTATELDL